LHVSLSISGYVEGLGLHNSGMFIINPPWTLKAALEKAMPWLADVLGQGTGSFVLQSGTAARAKKERDE
jgi:23S rRNA (adenine2030-N6)-methyltransferase